MYKILRKKVELLLITMYQEIKYFLEFHAIYGTFVLIIHVYQT